MNRRSLLALTTALGTLVSACGGASSAKAPPASTPSGGGASDVTATAPPAEQAESGAMPQMSTEESSSPSQPSAPPPAAAPGSDSSGRSSTASGAASRAPSKPKMDAAPEPTDRPGLGTQWGESRTSHITTVPFVRADARSPFATASLFYNDAEGARAMASATGFRKTPAAAFTVAGGAISLGLRDEHSGFLSGFVAGDKNYVVGEAGRRYTIILKNRSNARFECVISVDGLDVLDGKPASFSKRGYLLDPGGELEVDGFRQSTEAVAAFRFGSVRGSYANQKHGDTRNVGVIGVALFHERGSNPVFSQEEVDRRHDANPFPGRFATPPGQ
jgi:hypothetical protein